MDFLNGVKVENVFCFHVSDFVFRPDTVDRFTGSLDSNRAIEKRDLCSWIRVGQGRGEDGRATSNFQNPQVFSCVADVECLGRNHRGWRESPFFTGFVGDVIDVFYRDLVTHRKRSAGLGMEYEVLPVFVTKIVKTIRD